MKLATIVLLGILLLGSSHSIEKGYVSTESRTLGSKNFHSEADLWKAVLKVTWRRYVLRMCIILKGILGFPLVLCWGMSLLGISELSPDLAAFGYQLAIELL